MKLSTGQKLGFRLSALFSRFRHKMIGRHATAVLCETKNGRLLVDARDLVIGRALAFGGGYDDAALGEISKLLDRESHACIIGAHVGALAIPIARCVNRLTLYEANPRTFELLETNLKINDVYNCTSFNLAAGDSSRSIEFLCNTVNSGGSKMRPRTSSIAYTHDNPDVVPVDMVSLDEHLPEDQVFEFILMDIEGSEYLAVQGMQRLLGHCKHLHLEYVPHHLKNVAGVSNEQFLEKILPHFEQMKVIGRPETFLATQACRHLDLLRDADDCVDLLFSK